MPKQKNKKMSALELATLDLEAFQQDDESQDNITTTPAIQHIKVHPDAIKPAWFVNRQPWDMGNLASLEMNMATGQAVPILLRPTLEENLVDMQVEYDLVYGLRRWEVAKRRGMELNAIVEVLSDDDAIKRMWKENEDRESISAYSEALHFKKIKDEKMCSLRELADIFELAKSTLDDSLKLLRIPEEFWQATNNRAAIGKKLGSEIVNLIKENPTNKDALIKLAPKIGQGLIGSRTLRQEVSKLLNPVSKSTSKTTTHTSTHFGKVFKTSYDKSGVPSFKLNKTIVEILEISAFESDLVKLIERHAKKRK